jgi:large subunit ribosomal protein L25
MPQTMPKIETQTRDRIGSRYAARLREAGRLPAVVYGHGQEPLHLSVDAKRFVEVLHDNTHLVELALDGKAEACLIKDVQWDYLGKKIIHVDLARVDLTEEVEVEVEIEFVGEPVVLKTPGALFEHPETTLLVSCLANNIPERITVDISGLQADELITIGDLKLPEGIKAVGDEDTMICRISIVEETEDETPTGDAGAEPEVIGRGKAEEGEAEDK